MMRFVPTLPSAACFPAQTFAQTRHVTRGWSRRLRSG